jgi:hypothetical protein
MRPLLAPAALALALGAAACGTQESSLNLDQQEVLQTLAESAPAWTDEDPGADGAVGDAVVGPIGAGLFLAPGDAFHAPAFWGRLRRAHFPDRTRVVEIEGDTARVSMTVVFNGVLKVDTTPDGLLNPGTKPLHETARQRALLVRDSSTSHRWRLVGISVRRFQNSAEAERTVNITSVTVRRNSEAPEVLTDPEALLSPEALTSTNVGDTLAVVVQVANTTGTGLVPPTQMFIHVRHLRAAFDTWDRLPMQRQDDGSFRAHWVVRRAGRGVVAVDALDSETLATESGDDYRSDLWAVPVIVN